MLLFYKCENVLVWTNSQKTVSDGFYVHREELVSEEQSQKNRNHHPNQQRWKRSVNLLSSGKPQNLYLFPGEKKNDVEIFFPRMSTLSYNLL